MNKIRICIFSFIVFFSGCAVSTPTVVKTDKPSVQKPVVKKISTKPTLKRKVAIARFTNEAQYGKSNLFGLNGYNAQKQATDILSAQLTQSGKFILLERLDSDVINKELSTHNIKSLNVGADYLILGSITEFGRKSMSDTGVFSRSKTQIAYAKVSIRLVNTRTGQIIFAQEGSGEAKSEAGSSFGLGKHVGYDSTLNDKAISAAIGSTVNGIMQNLLSKPWRSYILSVENGNVLMAGGLKQGVKIGDIFSVYKRGKTTNNPQTGMPIELPGIKIATIKVASQFGSTYTDEGSVCQIVSGNIKGVNKNELYIQK